MDKLKVTLGPDGVERLPLADLVQLGERRLVEGQVLQRASRSSLYAEPWRRAAVDVGAVAGRAGLEKLPFAGGSQVVEAEKRHPLHRFPCTKVWAWFATDAPGEGRKWIPYAKQDLLLYMGLLARLGDVTEVKKGDVFLAVAPMAPRVTNAMPYLWLYTDVVDTQQGLEFLVGSMFMLGRSNWPDFALRRQPTVLLCRPQDALDLVEHFAQAAHSPEAKPEQLFERLRTGIFFGQPLAPRRDDIGAAYGVEAFDCYFTTEFPALFAECSAHNGLHLWMDVCIPEIIPMDELDKEKREPGYVPTAAFVDEASAGTEGELVLTTFGEALPLVRYRLGDLARVEGTDVCSCGITHPRVSILGKA
jgi:phenylacetate-coenzyme A ligase PaaK-like adenylate-forming protein